MNIFDPHISGSLSVSGSGEISGDLRVLGTISGTATNALTASEAPKYTLTSSFGSFTSSYTTGSFTGSFIGDGSGLTNIPASGVIGLNLTQIADGSVTASVSNSNGLRVNSNTEITGSLIVTGDIIGSVDFDTLRDKPTLVSGSSQIDITGTTGYSTFSSSINTSINSLSSSLTSSIGSLSSSIATTTSGLSSSVNSLSSSVTEILLHQSDRITSVENKTGSFATTGSNLFKGTQTHSGSIIPSVDNEYDLGSVTHQWRDVYISSGSLYIDGTKVISSTTQELQITTDNGQSIKILEGGTDSIILQTADGNVELKSNADGDILLDPTNGKILLKGTVEVLSGQKIQSSVGGTPVVFANDIVISGSIDLTGTIDGIDLTVFSSSVNTRVSNLETTTGNLSSYNSSNTTNINAIHTATSSLNEFTTSINTTIKSKLNTDGVISGSSQIIITGTTGYSTFSSSVSTSIGSLSSSIATTTNGLNSTITSLSSSLTSSIGSLSSSIATTTSGLSSTITSLSSSLTSSIGQLSSSIAVTTSGLGTSITNLSSSNAITDLNQTNRLVSLEGKSGSYATTGSNNFIGDQTITGSLYISQNLIVQGSSSLENITASAVSIGTNIIVLNTDTPAFRYAGVSVFDSGSTNITASLLYDSLENQWKFKHSDVGTNDASILLFGPLGNDIDNAPLLDSNYLTKVENNGHGHHITTSSIFDNGSKVSINSNTEITGTLRVTGTPIVSGSGQVSFNGITDKPTLVSGSAQVSFNGITDKPTLVSGSSQITYGGLTGIPSGIISGAAQLPSGVVSGSSQVLNGTGIFSSSVQLPSGLVSGSSQVLVGTTIHSGSFFNGITVVSGSAQISFNGITDKPTLVSGSSQVSFNGITDKPTLVSGSSQISYPSLSNIPGGIVSGSSQIDLTATTNYSSGIKTRLNAEGIVSGSSQITLSSTTGYGSVLNQAVLTTSTPTFAELTINSNQDGKLTLRVPSSGDNSDWNYINFVGANGARDMYFGTDSGGNPSWYRDDNGVNIGLGSVATVNGVQIVTNSGTWGIGISGNAGTVTNGVYTTGDQSIAGTKTFTGTINVTASEGREITTFMPSSYTTNDLVSGHEYGWYNDHWRLGMTRTGGAAGGDFVIQWNGARRLSLTSGGNLSVTGTISATNFSGTSSGTNTGDQTNISGNAATAGSSNFLTLQGTSNLRTVTTAGIYREEQPDSGFSYTTTLNMNSSDGRQQLTIERGGGGMKFRGSTSGSGDVSWSDWRTVWHSANLTNLNQLTNGPGYITSYTETDTLASVTARGSATSTLVALSGKVTLGNRSSASFNGNVGGLTINNTAEIRSLGAENPPALTWHYEGLATRHILMTSTGVINVVSPPSENSGVAILAVNGNTVVHSGNVSSFALPIGGGTLTGSRQMVFDTGGGAIRIRGNSGGWSMGTYYEGSSGTIRAGFGAYGGGNDLTWAWIGPGYESPWMTINSSNTVFYNSVLPSSNGTLNLGSSGARWNTVFTSDLSLSNGIGDYTIVEGENDLFLYNNKQNKVYKFMLQEVNPNDATPKRPE